MLAEKDPSLRWDDNGRWSRLATVPLILLVRLWQIGPSRLLPPSCRYTPSCSAYAIGALRRYGPVVGLWLTLRRVLRCNPWGGCGHDPVPPLKDRSLV